MKVNIKSTNISLPEEIMSFLDKKVKMLSRRYVEILGVEINFRVEKSSHNSNKICEMRLIISGYDLLASSQSKTFEEAISKTSEALERQIEKRKTVLKKEVIGFSGTNSQNI